jgi:hypothetical protein
VKELKRGRPAKEPTDAERKHVKGMASVGVSEINIAKIIGCDAKTLRKHFWTELENGHIEANAQVAAALFRKATSPDVNSASVSAAVFWLKARAGWKEAQAEEQGKKEHREAAARHAERGTSWESLLPN